MRAYERFLNYAVVYTRSDENSRTVPSTARQFDLANLLARELLALGVADAAVDDNCVVFGHIPATPGREHEPPLGFLAHMDTADYAAEHVVPRLWPNYGGGALDLGHGVVLSPERFPHLRALRGRTLITASGDTLLGADDKAGVAEIMTMAETLLAGKTPHGPVCLAFTPDEEVGEGTAHFDLARFGAKYAYTVDGGAEGEIEYENFNACAADFRIRGVDVHPGSAKGVMVNAVLVAAELNAMLPPDEIPARTEGYEGFYHLLELRGIPSEAFVHYIVRDHSAEGFAARKAFLRRVEQAINEKYGPGTAVLGMRDQYHNMAELIRRHPQLVENAKRAAEAAGLKPKVVPIRGGTDGALLAEKGLPCPNLGTGGYCFHGPFEHITCEGMDGAAAMLTALAAMPRKGEN